MGKQRARFASGPALGKRILMGAARRLARTGLIAQNATLAARVNSFSMKG
jgi:hypothetical protein